jgi:serine/threonine protein kinase
VTWEEEAEEAGVGLSPALLLDFADHGTLQDLLESPEQLTFDEKVNLCLEVGKGLLALHEAGCVHRDIKPQNVLVQSHTVLKYVAKITDFDLSLNNPEGLSAWQGGTPPYNAPEWKEMQCLSCAKQADIFS